MGLDQFFIVRNTFIKYSLPDARMHLWQLKESEYYNLLDSGRVISFNLDVVQVIFFASQVTEIEQFKLRSLYLVESGFKLLFLLFVIVSVHLFNFIFSGCMVDFRSVR